MKSSVKSNAAATTLKKTTDKYTAKLDEAPVYKESGRTQSAYNQWTNYEKNNKPSEQYAGTWAQTLNDKINAYANQDPYSYKSQNDPAYQQYKDQYTRNGQKAMQDTMGQAAALTGGYGSTYAVSAGQQQYNNYMGQLADKNIELENQAYNRYMQDRADQGNVINTLSNVDNTEYSRWRDRVNDYNTFLSYLQNKYQTLQNIDSQTFQNELSLWNTQLNGLGNLMSTAQGNYQYENTNDINNYQYEKNFAENQRQYDLNRQDSNKNTAYSSAMSLISSGIMPDSATLATAGISTNAAKQMINQVKKNTVSSVGKSGNNITYDYTQAYKIINKATQGAAQKQSGIAGPIQNSNSLHYQITNQIESMYNNGLITEKTAKRLFERYGIEY